MASQKEVMIDGFIGGSYQLKDTRMAANEYSLNMYTESVKSNNYTQKLLRSIDGNVSVHEFASSDNSIGCRGLFQASRGPDGSPDLYMVFDNKLYRTHTDLSSFTEIGSVGSTLSAVKMAECGGINNALLAVTGATSMYGIETGKSDTESSGALQIIPLPESVYHDGLVQATHIVNMRDKVICNDKLTGQIYISRTGASISGTVQVYDLDADGNIQYEADSPATPLYKDVSSRDYFWKNNLGQYQYETVMSSTADPCLALEVVNNSELWTFGYKSYDVWNLNTNSDGYSISNTTFGTTIGISAPYSLARVQSQLCWLGAGEDGINGIWLASSGSRPVKISTPALERHIATMNNITEAFGFGYTYEGHAFYILTFQDADETFVYDLTTQLWHNRGSRDKLTNDIHYWEPAFACAYNGHVYFGSYKTNNLLTMTQSSHTEWDGRPIIRMRKGPILIKNLSKFIINRFKLGAAVGLTSVLDPIDPSTNYLAEGYKPQVMCRYSHDGGNTWYSCNNASLGIAGDYGAQVEFGPMGMGQYFVIEVSITDNVDFVITAAKAFVTPTNLF